ncbi:MAG TPA: AAA family ATPase [Candidatus Saccharimonadales bacterium]|nr:AAA family ATPase [Candidatus Saccharimonadales bacterium]
MYKRAIEPYIEEYLRKSENKILFIWGPRRSGKTTLLEKISKEQNIPIFNFDSLTDRERFIPRKEILAQLVAEHKIILIDEVQNYPESTVSLKLLHDEFHVKIIATGSSELRQKSKDFDTLADRFVEQYCLPLSISEIANNTRILAYEKNSLEEEIQTKLQIFGAYPEIYASHTLSEDEKIEKLQKILDTYILKDVINIYDLKNEKLAKDILTKIALQLGSEVSIREIATDLGANKTTVSNYIEIFIKNYILIPLPSFKTNARKAVSEHRKLYFYDLGIRNILVKDFRDLSLRPDKGGLFENFIIIEIEKQRKINTIHETMYFYREYGGKEIDVVLEDYKKKYTCLELNIDKNNGNEDIFPLPHKFLVINKHNYFEIIASLNK